MFQILDRKLIDIQNQGQGCKNYLLPNLEFRLCYGLQYRCVFLIGFVALCLDSDECNIAYHHITSKREKFPLQNYEGLLCTPSPANRVVYSSKNNQFESSYVSLERGFYVGLGY